MISKVRGTAAVILAMLVLTTASAQPSPSPEQACAVGDVLETGDSCDVFVVDAFPRIIIQPNGQPAWVTDAWYRFAIQSDGEWRLDCLSPDCVDSYAAPNLPVGPALLWLQRSIDGQTLGGRGFAACPTSPGEWLIEALPTEPTRANVCQGCFILNSVGDIAVAGATTDVGACTVGLVLGPGGSCTRGSLRIEWSDDGFRIGTNYKAPTRPDPLVRTAEGVVGERICDLNRFRILKLP